MHNVNGRDIRRQFGGNAPRNWQKSIHYGKKLLKAFRSRKAARVKRMKRVNPLPWMRQTPKSRTRAYRK